MDIQYRTQPAPTIPEHINEALLEMEPRVFLRWNKQVYQRHDLSLTDGTHPWEGRWEIWCELANSRHPDATNERQRTDRWNTEHQCLMRKLQNYETDQKEYAPLDWGLITGLEMADGWSDRLFYEDKVYKPKEAVDALAASRQDDIIRGVTDHYSNYNQVQVGAGDSSGYRHRQSK